MFNRRQILFWPLALMALVLGMQSAMAEDEPTALVKRTAERMLSTLETRRAEVERNPAAIYGMVERIAAPHFDFERITQGAVGKHWRQASAAQRQALTDGFKQVLIRTYARSLLSYSGQEIRYLPLRQGNRPGMVTLPTEVRDAGAAPIPVDYRLYQKGGKWMVYDVVISNVSLVGNYRGSFANEIARNGIDALITRLKGMNAKGQD